MKTRQIVTAVSVLLPLAGQTAFADDAKAPAPWIDTLAIHGQLEAGIDANFSSPSDHLNYGQLYTDRATTPVLNQGLLSVGRPVDPKATDYDFGFKVQGMYGTDARYTHFARLFDKTTKSPDQFDIVEASVTAHTPWLTEGGVDLQAGLWPTLLGFETIDASTNPFYSHSYIYNFGLPVKEAGANGILHLTDWLDLYAGVVAGNQTIPGADNNGSASFIGGFKVTLADGNFSVLALTHYGPENASRAVKPLSASKYNRAYNDMIITYKASDAVTFTTELNYVREDLGAVQAKGRIANAEGYGIAQYGAWTLSDAVTFNLRGEVFADTRGYFVAAFPGSLSSVQLLEGYTPSISPISYGGHNVYGALTAGVTYKPALPDAYSAATLLIRPELRADEVMSGPARFNAGKNRTAVTAAIDAVLTY